MCDVSLDCDLFLGTLQVPTKLLSKGEWNVADFEHLLTQIPDIGDVAAADADLVVVDALIGEDVCVVFTCPRLFRYLVAFSCFSLCFGLSVCSRLKQLFRNLLDIFFCV